MNRHSKLSVMPVVLAVLLLAASAFADTLGRHPRYLHARSDLRLAYRMLRMHDEPNVMYHVRAAADHINNAIIEIDRAAVIDRKYINKSTPIDTNLDRPGRFSRVMALLVSARDDIAHEEDNPRAIAWRNAAFRQIDAAMFELRRAARNLHMDRLEGF